MNEGGGGGGGVVGWVDRWGAERLGSEDGERRERKGVGSRSVAALVSLEGAVLSTDGAVLSVVWFVVLSVVLVDGAVAWGQWRPGRKEGDGARGRVLGGRVSRLLRYHVVQGPRLVCRWLGR